MENIEKQRKEGTEMKKAYIFDLDGTLVDSIPTISHFANQALIQYGCKPVEEDLYKLFLGEGSVKLVHRLLDSQGKDIEENFEKVHTMYNKTYDEDYLYLCKPYEGITELIEELKKQQCIVAVLSNKPHSTTVKIIEALFGKGTFTKIYGQREGIPLKPDAQALCSILDELELSKEECVYIGDTKTDMLTGKNANVFTVGVLWGFRDRDELEQYQADVIISSPEELLAIE